MTAPSVQVLVDFGANHTDVPLVDSEFETGIGSWVSPGGGATLVDSTAQAHAGTHSLAITGTGSFTGWNALSGLYPAAPGINYTATAFVRAAAAGTNTVTPVMGFYDKNGLEISGPFGTAVVATTTGWTMMTVSGLSPAGTVYVTLSPQFTASAGATFYLDTVTFTHTYTDVSSFLTGTIQTQRGRSRETDQYSGGTASFILRNESRDFDPSNTSSPYYPGIIPRASVQILVDGVKEFVGYVDDIAVAYTMPNICTTTFTCVDGLAVPANVYLNNYTPISELTGARVLDVLNIIRYPPGVWNVATGNTLLSAGTFNNVAAMDHLQAVARTENGFLFVDRTGLFTFLDRYHVGTETSQATFSDDGTAISYQAIVQNSQSLLLYNRVVGTRDGGTQQEADDIVSQAEYLVRSLLLGQLENASDADTLSLCQYMVGRYSQPEVRFGQITLELQSLTSAQLATVLALDLVQLVTVKRTPPGTGTPSVITILSTVENIGLALDVSNSTYTMTIGLGSVDSRAFLVLDDPIFGVMDGVNKWAY